METDNCVEPYRSIVDSTEDSICLVDENSRYLFVNRRGLERMGLPGKEWKGHYYSEFHSPEETKLFAAKIGMVFKTGCSTQCEYRSTRDFRCFLQTFSPVKNSNGDTVAIAVISKDITDMKRVEERLMAMSFTDDLTGLYNRRGFFTLAEQQLRLANREKRGRIIFLADLDNLKEINDTYGHREGDKGLLWMAVILKKSFRESDIIARIGGDEFVIMATESREEEAKHILERLQVNLEIGRAEQRGPYPFSFCMGMTYYSPVSPCSISELIAQADSVMYEQKRKKQGV